VNLTSAPVGEALHGVELLVALAVLGPPGVRERALHILEMIFRYRRRR
jgi:hypothetical protein